MEILILILGALVVFQIFSVRSLRERVERLEKGERLHLNDTSLASTTHLATMSEVGAEPAEEGALKQLRLYIKDQIMRGQSREVIENNLSVQGWSLQDIASAFSVLASVQPLPYVYQAPEASGFDLVAWCKEDWLLKLGALLLLIALGWFTSYAFMNNWIGSVGRVTLGLLFGAVLLVLGWWRMQRHPGQGGVFLVVGSTTIILTLYAARVIYEYFTPATALALMFLATAFVAVASVVYQRGSLAVASLLLATLAPLLTDAPNPSALGLFLYLGVVIIGTLWVVAVTGQRSLSLIALIIVGLYSLAYVDGPGADQSVVLMFVFAFTTVFFVASTLSILRSSTASEVFVDLWTTGLNGAWLIAWILLAVDKEWQSLVFVAWMLVFIVGAFTIFRLTGKQQVLFTYAGVGVALLAAATAVELEGAALTIAFTLETAIIIVFGYLLTNSVVVAQRLSVLLVVPLMFTLASLGSSKWQTGVFHDDFFVVLLMCLTLLGLGVFFKDRAVREDGAPALIAAPLFIIGSYLGYVLWWLSLQAGLASNAMAVVIALVTYTVIGIYTYIYGVANDNRGLKIYGGILIVLVVLRLLFVDIWSLSLEGRIIAFFVVGVLLMSTAFIGKFTRK